ncbi:hypothetical protein TSUD_97200, partial [Trifolium subterraneum]
RDGSHHGEQRCKEKQKTEPQVSAIGDAETVTNKLSGIHIGESSVVHNGNEVTSTAILKPKSYGTVNGGALVGKVNVDGSCTRSRMIDMVSKGLATLEVSLKHSGSLFMYAGHEGGAYAKNSFRNIYTAVGVFVLWRTLREAWGTEALKKQAEFNNFLERNHMCVSMELVTAVLGDHGQRPHEDYVVVTAVTELDNGKPKFYSTPEIIAFCRKWQLPTNHVWLFSTSKSASSFFAKFDALCEEGTATSVCKALDEIADISVPASKDHVKAQGEILEGLVARLVSHESSNHIEKILKEFPPPPADGAAFDFGLSLREICSANRSDKKQPSCQSRRDSDVEKTVEPYLAGSLGCPLPRSKQMKALLESVGSSFCPDYLDWSGTDAADIRLRIDDESVLPKFLQAHPADYSTKKLQEIIQLMREKKLRASIKCYHNFHKVDAISNDNLFYKMVIHVHNDSTFQKYKNEMRKKPGLWPLYRGFFVDVNIFKADKEKVAEISKNSSINESRSTSTQKDDFADEDANLMVKLKFLTYKLRTFLIRNGLSYVFDRDLGAYEAYYRSEMNKWGTSPAKLGELSEMLVEWANYIRTKCENKKLSSSIYLSEAEPFLEQFAKLSPQNQALIGSAGNLVRTEDFLAIVKGGQDEEGDLVSERDITPSGPNMSLRDTVPKEKGMIVFFPVDSGVVDVSIFLWCCLKLTFKGFYLLPGIPGCAKSALCKELQNVQGGLLNRPVLSLMGDLIKGKYWKKVAEECKKKPRYIILADKNAPNEKVWAQNRESQDYTPEKVVEYTNGQSWVLCYAWSTAVVSSRVTSSANNEKTNWGKGYCTIPRPGQIEKMCPAVPVVPESEGTDSNPFSLDALAVFMFRVLQRVDHPGNLDKASLNAGYVLLMFYHLYNGKRRKEFEGELIDRFGSLVMMPLLKSDRKDSTKGTYTKEWMQWEKQLQNILFGNADYFNSVQVPFEIAVKQVLEQLRNIAKGDYMPPDTEKRSTSTIVFDAISLPVIEIQGVLNNLAKNNPKIDEFLKDKHLENLNRAHLTLAHTRSHGIDAVADYGLWRHKKAPVELTALFYSDKMAAFEAFPGSVEGEKIVPKNALPHITLWTSQGVSAKEANMLPQLFAEGKANRIDLNPPINVSGMVEFF